MNLLRKHKYKIKSNENKTPISWFHKAQAFGIEVNMNFFNYIINLSLNFSIYTTESFFYTWTFWRRAWSIRTNVVSNFLLSPVKVLILWDTIVN